jgi:hypothetical protein
MLPTLRAIVAGASLIAGAAATAAAAAAQTRVNEDAQLIAEFLKRAQAYVEILHKADSSLPEAPNAGTPEQIEAHERAVQKLIIAARATATTGDIFTQPIRAYFRRQIVRATSGPDGQQIRDAIMEENPGPIRLRVNGRYPDTVPTTTMPPPLLAALPKLPRELEFRFMGNRLILLDVHAQLVVDFMDDAIRR